MGTSCPCQMDTRPAHNPESRIPSNPLPWATTPAGTVTYRTPPMSPAGGPGPGSDVALQQRRHLPISRHWNQVHAVECA